VTTLVRPDRPEDDLEDLRARVVAREAELDERAAEADRIGRELDMFAATYKQQVGTLHEQLDRLELDIAEAELGELSKAVADGAAAPSATPAPSMDVDAAPSARLTSDAVRALFRDVARIIHPDLADDEHTRDRRHALMVEANRAYKLRDAEQLRRILEQWERSPEAVQGTDAAAIRLRLERRLVQIEEDLALCARDLAALEASQLSQLKALADEAAAKGNDLIADMVRRLKRDILAATNRLDAMRSMPS
jgi:ABC-type phosphate transport system auxiliary subunit